MYHLCAWYLCMSKVGIRSPENEITDRCEPICECWEPNPGPSWSFARAASCSPGCPGTHYVDQAGLELRENLPASASQVLGLEDCATTTRLLCFEAGSSMNLELTYLAILFSDLQGSACLCYLKGEITGTCDHVSFFLTSNMGTGELNIGSHVYSEPLLFCL